MALLLAVAMTLLAGLATPVAAQNMFAPVVRVNDQVITNYELTQRTLFLTLLKAPGNVRELATEQLIQERLEAEVAKQMGISITEEKLKAGMEEFAGRANLSAEEFVAALAQAGVAAETFRDFVSNGMIWRDVVRARFIPKIQVSEAEVARAMARAEPTGKVRVLLSEIMLPADTPVNKRASTRRAAELARITDPVAFAQAARRYSVSQTRAQGGEIGWKNLSDLPAALAGKIARMQPGQVTPPIPMGERIGLFLLRDRKQVNRLRQGDLLLQYAEYFMPGGRSPATLAQAQKIIDRIDTCDDLYGVAKGQPEEALKIERAPASTLPADIALELDRLDPGEVSTALTTNGGQTLVLLMLCERSRADPEVLSRDDIELQLRNQRLAAMANLFLEELMADAHIEYLDR